MTKIEVGPTPQIVLLGKSEENGNHVTIWREKDRFTIRRNKISGSGVEVDNRYVSGRDLETALSRAREAGYPRAALMSALSHAEEYLEAIS